MLSLVDTILNNTALPNLHPALVHFPIALFPLAIGFDLVVAIGRRVTLDRVTAVLYALAALSAGAAVWAGERAVDALSGLPEDLRSWVHEHGEWAEWFLWASVALALARIALVWWQGRRSGSERLGLLAPRAAVIAAALGTCVLLFGAADRGGALVYSSGVAVMAVGTPDRPESAAEPAEIVQPEDSSREARAEHVEEEEP